MNQPHTLDPCAGAVACVVPPAEFVRLRYFFGQHLGVVDLADEQSYVVGKQRFHNLRLHGIGVVCGLRAERYVFPQGSPSTNPTTILRVRRGAALDGCGREIVVGWDQCIDVAAWYAQHPAAHPAAGAASPLPPLRLWVALCYQECPSDPAPAPRDPCGCDAGGCEFARIREGFRLKLLTDAEAALLAPDAPHASGASDPEPVADEVLDGSWESAYGRWLALRVGADCPKPPTDPCLLLANFQATLNATGQQVLDLSEPDNAIPERRSLVATSLLQGALLRALASANDAELAGAGPRFAGLTFGNAGGDSGTLTIAILTTGADLARDPFAAPAQLTVSVSRFKDDGTWETAPAMTPGFVPATTSPVAPPHLDLSWAAGSGLAAGRYRLLITNDPAQPVVDTRMRPLTPWRWARHFHLTIDTSSGNLVLADALYP